ncbi:unnamed protein product [Microthlaspi erraticum]|uniref:Uncharacterized protein n=1 Tax=Microthlaspi erraticum TaxID=1685480 RepID=A0A6D2JJJ4_9BRAS|nr:unnamed protein product [Microthlaspi erraticum]
MLYGVDILPQYFHQSLDLAHLDEVPIPDQVLLIFDEEDESTNGECGSTTSSSWGSSSDGSSSGAGPSGAGPSDARGFGSDIIFID